MTNTKSNNFSDIDLPVWFRITLVGFVSSHWYIFLYALTLPGDSDPFKGESAIFYFAFLAFVMLGFLLVSLIWLVPKNKYLTTFYFYLRQYRWVVILLGFALLAVLLISGKSISSVSRLLIYLNAVTPILVGIILKPVPLDSRLATPCIFNWLLMIIVALSPAINPVSSIPFRLGLVACK